MKFPTPFRVAGCQGVAEAKDAEAFGERVIHNAGLCHCIFNIWKVIRIESLR